MTTEIAIENPKKAPRKCKRTRRVKEAENANTRPPAPAHDSTEPVVETKVIDAALPEAAEAAEAAEPARLSPRPRRVEPDDARAIAAQVGRGAREASEAYSVVMPGDLCPGVKDHFWRTVGRAIDRGLPNEVVLPLIGAFEAVLLATASVTETARRFDQLATDAHTLRRYGHGAPSKKGTEFNVLQKELIVEFLAGSSSAFLVGAVEHVRRACPTLSWRLREIVVTHLLGMYRAMRGETAGLPGERQRGTSAISQEIDRLGAARRKLVNELGEQKAAGLDAMLVNAWVETDSVLVNWVDNAITKQAKANRQMAAAIVQAHIQVEVG